MCSQTNTIFGVMFRKANVKLTLNPASVFEWTIITMIFVPSSLCLEEWWMVYMMKYGEFQQGKSFNINVILFLVSCRRLAHNDLFTIPLEAKPIYDQIAANSGGMWVSFFFCCILNGSKWVTPCGKAGFISILNHFLWNLTKCKGLFYSWMSHNPLVCTKELQWLQTWMKTHSVVVRDLDGVTCQTPYGNLSKVFDFDFSILGKQSIVLSFNKYCKMLRG